jgi:hypothetical protein
MNVGDSNFNLKPTIINMVQQSPLYGKTSEDANAHFQHFLEITQICLSSKEAMFKNYKESSQHLKPLYVWGQIDKQPISRMLIDGGATVNLMPYSVFKKLGREDDELVKTNLTLNDMGAT